MEEYRYNGPALQVVQSFCTTSLILLKFFVAKMVLDEVGPGVFGIKRNNASKAAITSYNSYDSHTVFSRRDYANSFISYVRAKRDSLVQDGSVWSGPQNNLHGSKLGDLWLGRALQFVAVKVNLECKTNC